MIKSPLDFLETFSFNIEYVIISLMLKNMINRKGKVAIKLAFDFLVEKKKKKNKSRFLCVYKIRLLKTV